MASVGLRELRQNASELVRRVEAGEQITITVAGRETAQLVAAGASPWQTWADIEGLFHGSEDPEWTDDRELVNGDLQDPWQAQ